MTKETERFLEAEQAAEELVEALKKLHDEAVSYKTSTSQLEAVRAKLVTFIEASQRISQDTKTAVELLKSIGGPAIFDSLSKLDIKVVEVGTDVKSTSKTLEQIIETISSELKANSERLVKLQKLVITTVGISFVVLIVGIILLIK